MLADIKKEEFFKLFWKKPVAKGRHLTSEDHSDANTYYSEVYQGMLVNHHTRWNWSAAVFGSIWLAYRKMYALALAYIILRNLCIALVSINGGISDSQTLTIGICFHVFAFLIFGLFGNMVYFKDLQRRYHSKKWKHKLGTVDYIAVGFWFVGALFDPYMVPIDIFPKHSALFLPMDIYVFADDILFGAYLLWRYMFENAYRKASA